MNNQKITIGLSPSQIRNGLIGGIVAYVLGVLIAFLAGPLSEAGESVPRVEGFEAAMTVFYNSHLVGYFTLPTSGGCTVYNVITIQEQMYLFDSPVPPVIWLLLPVLLLVLSGFVLNHVMYIEPKTAETAFITGALVFVGYLPLLIIGTYVFGNFDWMRGIIVAGLIYPSVFGGVGGYLSYKLSYLKSEKPSEQGQKTN